jgi:hypothetical protein
MKELVLQMAMPFLGESTSAECESGFEPRATKSRRPWPIDFWGGVKWEVKLAESLRAEGEGLGFRAVPRLSIVR